MNKTRIEWCDYTWNPIKGYCPNNCPYCYAHRMYNRFGWDKTLRFDKKEALTNKLQNEKSLKIFVGSMIEMYHPQIRDEWVNRIIAHTMWFDWHTYITLTKMPHRLGHFVFPQYWWVGVTMDKNIYDRIWFLKENKTIMGKKFVSFEPLLSPMKEIELNGLDWIIIGGLTPKPVHKKEWIDDIVDRADDLNIPIFIKPNAHYPIIRREFPK